MYRFAFCLLHTFAVATLCAQEPFTEKQYAWQIEKNIVYGTAANYLGLTDTLTLDLYKPLSADTARPLLVLVHGGAWLGGCKEDMAWLCEEMAARGYVTATINYRKGWHKAFYVPNPAQAADINPLYAADSLEIIRAIYRGMQDVKGAIRWLKARMYTDSTCNQAVLVGGESAGAFVALAVGLLDRPVEKPAASAALPDAPVPANNVINKYILNCLVQTPALPPGALLRPNLGSVDGTLNLNGHDASVLGVVSFYGGLPSEAFAQNWLDGPQPALYLFHQTCDGVVPFGYGIPYYPISTYCNLGFTPWHYNYPRVFGNGSIAAKAAALPTPPPVLTEFFNCNAFEPNFALFECIRYNDNGSYHWVTNRTQRAEKIAAFFSPIVATKLQSQPCLVDADEPNRAAGYRLAPNPFSGTGTLLFCEKPPAEPVQLRVTDAQGRLLWQGRRALAAGPNSVPLGAELPPGMYFLQVSDGQKRLLLKAVKM
ncbi:MAG: T9SS type A sorting domain-containing protein [Saprospiraceae bacterium]